MSMLLLGAGKRAGGGATPAPLAVSTTNLVSFWKLDESSGTRYDSFGSNGLTDNNTVLQATSLTGVPYTEAADFTAANSEYLSVNSTDFNFGTDGDFTFTGWIKMDSTGVFHRVMSVSSSSPGYQYQYLFRVFVRSNDVLELQVGNNSTSVTETASTFGALSSGVWYFVAAWHDSANNLVGLSVDGVEDSTTWTGGTYDSGGYVNVGRDPYSGGPSYTDSSLGAFGIWSRVLTSAEITALANPDDPFYDQFSVSKENLVSFWKLNESSGTRYDSFGSNDLTDNNTVLQATSLTGVPYTEAAEFVEANTEFLSIAINSDFQVGTDGDFTFAFWVKFNDTGSYLPLFCVAPTTPGFVREYVPRINKTAGDKIQLSVGNNTTQTQLSSAASVSSGTWYFIACWHDASVNKIYIQIDGSTPDEAAHTIGTYNPTGTVTFGKDAYSTGSYGDFDMGAAMWFKRVLTSAEITALANANDPFYDQFSVVSKENLVSFWKLDESSGTRYDAHGSNDLTDNNTVGQSTGNVYANAADFELDNSEYLSDPDDASHPSGSMTFACWVKAETFTDFNTISHKWAAAKQEWAFFVYDPGGGYVLAFTVDANGSGQDDFVSSSSTVSTGTWYHVAFRHDADADTIAVFIDGVKTSKSYTGGLFNGTSPLEIGGFSGSGLVEWDGLIQAVGWWDRALSDAEITALANPNDPFYNQF